MELSNQISSLNQETLAIIEKRLNEFKDFKLKNNEAWFSELCFCILTANSRAKTAIRIQDELGFRGFFSFPEDKIVSTIKENKHRFHNNKAKYILEARQHLNIKNQVNTMANNLGVIEARNWLAENVKGLGYKEASHFLRNVGFDNIAILDRHILNLMVENNLIKEKPKPLKKANYLEIENSFLELAKSLNLTPAKLDLMMWYLKTGEVLK